MNVKQVLSEALGGVQGANQPRGLHNFIQEIRLCSNSAKEQVSVEFVTLSASKHTVQAGANTQAAAHTELTRLRQQSTGRERKQANYCLA